MRCQRYQSIIKRGSWPRGWSTLDCQRSAWRQAFQGNQPPRWNPQNVPDPLGMPSSTHSPEQCISTQLNAMMDNDNPWPNHGLQTAYEYGLDIGGMDRSKYFGYAKDLYHFDHFMGHFPSVFPELLSGFASYSIDKLEERDGVAFAWVTCNDGNGEVIVKLRFVLDRKDVGLKQGAWMTARLLREAEGLL